MKSNLLATLCIAITAFAPLAIATPITLELNNLNQGNNLGSVTTSEGFVFTADHLGSRNGADCSRNDCPYNGTTYLFSESTPISLAFNGALFSLVNFDGGEGFVTTRKNAPPINTAGRIEVTGQRADLSTITQTFRLDGESDGNGDDRDFQTFTLTNFADLIKVTFTGVDRGQGTHFSLDNVAVMPTKVIVDNDVPEPGSLALSGLALLAAGAVRRKAG